MDKALYKPPPQTWQSLQPINNGLLQNENEEEVDLVNKSGLTLRYRCTEQ